MVKRRVSVRGHKQKVPAEVIISETHKHSKKLQQLAASFLCSCVCECSAERDSTFDWGNGEVCVRHSLSLSCACKRRTLVKCERLHLGGKGDIGWW